MCKTDPLLTVKKGILIFHRFHLEAFWVLAPKGEWESTQPRKTSAVLILQYVLISNFLMQINIAIESDDMVPQAGTYNSAEG